METQILDYEKIGQKMRQIRKQAGITQEQIATRLGVTVSLISNMENNRCKVNLRTIYEYSQILNVPADYLLSQQEDEIDKQQYMIQLFHLLKDCTIEEIKKYMEILTILKS